jgi:MFS family permease
MRSPSKPVYFLLLVFTLLLHPASSVSQDSFSVYQITDTLQATDSAKTGIAVAKHDDEFDTFLLLFGTAAVCFMLGFVFLGLIAGLILILILVALVTTGILSVSVISGWYKKSITKGIKTLFVLLGTLGGIAGGILCFGIASLLFELQLEQKTIAMAGSITGGIAGFVLGIVLFKILLIALNYIKRKLMVGQ